MEARRTDVGRQIKVKLHLEIDNIASEASFTRAEDGATLEWNGSKFEAVLNETEPGRYLVLIDGRVFWCEVQPLKSGQAEITVNGRRILTRVRDLKHLRGGGPVSSAVGGRVEISTPMPGKVVRILRGAGEDVKAGDGVIIVEAMKMQNEIQSPRDGKVIEIRFDAGQTVNAGDILAIIE
jgi:biotin carboxyl carrier protein